MLSSGEVFEVYLQFQPFREIVPELRVLVQPLRSLEAMVPVRAEGYYATALDSALVALRFDRAAADRFGRARLGRCVAEIGVPLIVPEQLSFERRCAFFLNHLTSYTIYVQAHAEDGAEERGPIESVIVRLSQHARAASAAGLALRRSAMAHAGRAATPPPA